MSISKGKLITFEGIDGSGKSTQAKRLVDYLNKSKETAIFVREPGGTTISEEIRDILLNRHLEDINDRTEALLMTGSPAQLTHEIIIPNLNKGLHVIADRYSDSTLAYQGGGRQIDLDWLIDLNKFATYNLDPNITFFIDLIPEEAFNRKNKDKDRIEMAGIELQNRRSRYLFKTISTISR
ncbi:MAG: thymidylate kinase [Candidatus Neomarinimicrobiota bacterium]|nr:MAG: thymidylate kinase [Candidatus Neomarinimicrobiota bacterium]